MNENAISAQIIDASIRVHKALGPGLLESVYEEVLAYELEKRGLKVERQKTLPVIYDEREMKVGFRTDLIVEEKVIVEIKSVESLIPIHFKITQNYLRLTGLKLGLLINFNEILLKNGLNRIVNGL